jgi:bcr-type benzoyl-CoA reductase subunit C
MHDIKVLLKEFSDIASSPAQQLKKVIASGKKAVGIFPYFCPEELVDAAGMVPFGIWGADMQAAEAKRYYPAFICSILQTALELGLKGAFNELSAVMIPTSCDSLKGMSANWRYGVKTVPVIEVAIAQNRKTAAGIAFTAAKFRKIRDQLSEISGKEITDEAVAASIAVYNENRAALRAFSRAAALHPELISPTSRNAFIKAGYFMPKAEHTRLVNKLCTALDALPVQKWEGLRIVTTGIIADCPQLLKILEDNNIAIADDQIAYESVYFKNDTPLTTDPFIGMAERISNIEGCSVLYDPEKKRAKTLAELVKASKADGVLHLQTKFCDPEEYDYVPVKTILAEAGIPLLQIEIDRQTANYEQARSAIEAFRELLT